jgi:hypothetical protein
MEEAERLALRDRVGELTGEAWLAALEALTFVYWPEDIDGILERLTHILTDEAEEESIRARAITCRVTFGIDEALALVVCGYAVDERRSEALRAAAAHALHDPLERLSWDEEALTEDSYQRIQSALQTIFLDAREPDVLRRRALEASVHAPEPWHIDAVAFRYVGDDLDWKRTAVRCMRSLPCFDDMIVDALESEDSELLIEACWAARRWHIADAWYGLQPLATAEDTPDHVRMAAINAMISVDPEATSLFLRCWSAVYLHHDRPHEWPWCLG